MRKAYLSVLRLAVMILAFMLGMVSSFILFIGVGYFAARYISLDGLSKIGIVIDTSEVFDPEVKNPVKEMSILELMEEISKVSAISETATLGYLSDEYGLILPPAGDSKMFDAMCEIPLSELFSQKGMDTALATIRVGEVMGYEKKTNTADPENPKDYWFDAENNEEVSGVEALLADYTLYRLLYDGISVSDLVDDECIGTILGYTEEGGKWYKFDADGTRVQVTGITAIIAGKTLDNLGDSIKDEKIGVILGYENVDGEWVKDNGETKLSGSMKVFADYTFNTVEEGLDNEPLGNILGYEIVDGEWYNGDKKVTGIMKSMADRNLKNLNTVDQEKMGDLLGYRYIAYGDADFVPVNPTDSTDLFGDYPNGYWVNPDSENPTEPCSAFVQIMSDATMDNMDTLQSQVTIGKLIPESERTGFLSLLKPDTTIDGLSAEVVRVFDDATVGQLVDCGAIELTPEEKAKLEANDTLKNGNLTNLLKMVLNMPTT